MIASAARKLATVAPYGAVVVAIVLLAYVGFPRSWPDVAYAGSS